MSWSELELAQNEHSWALAKMENQPVAYKLDPTQSDKTHDELTQVKSENRRNQPLDGFGWIGLFW